MNTAARKTRVYLAAGAEGRRQGVEKALQLLSSREDLLPLFHGERVLVKPNCVSATRKLSATHVGALEAVLDFLTKYDPKRIILGEGSAEDTLKAFRNFGYLEVAKRYGAEILDLNRDEAVPLSIYDWGGRPRKVPVAKTALESVRVSVALPKTHDTVVITASLKNMVVGAIRNPDKPAIHQGYPAINLNLALLGRHLRPHVAVVDGFVGMEGDGPTQGDPVDHRVALAGTDSVAVDAACAYLMGFDPERVGYLVHAARLGLGVLDLAGIEVIGSTLEKARRRYRPHRTYRKQLSWQPSEELSAVLEGQRTRRRR